MTRDVAVIIASLNSPMIHEVVAAVAAQEGVEGVREVLVVGRDDAELLQPGRLPGGGAVRLLDTGRPVSAAVARNLGLAAITADDTLVIFLDADCLPQAGWLRAHLAAHAHPGPPHVVSGSVITPTDTYWSLVYNLSLFYAFLDTAPAAAHLALPTLNLSFPFALSRIVGPFDETLLRAADMDWTLRARRAGIALVFDPAPSVVHRHARHSLRAVWHDCASSGFHSRRIRLRYVGLVGAPALLRFPLALRILSPLLATWVTLGVVARSPATFKGRWSALPGFWLTKLAWSWGAGRPA